MNFQPKTEEEIQRDNLLEKGEYDFEVIEALDTKSKSGNDMIKLKISVFGPNGEAYHVFDYLLGAMEAKLRHFCAAVGILSKYEDGTLCADDCLSRAGLVLIVIKEDKTGQYGPRNEVRDYIVPKPVEAGATPKTADEDGDDIPF